MGYMRAVEIAAPVARVFRAWSSADEVQQWLAPKARVEFYEGGAYEFFWSDDPAVDSTSGCKLLAIVADERLRFEWQGRTDFSQMFQPPHGPTEIEVRFVPTEQGTRVIVEQRETRDLANWAEYDQWMADTWEFALAGLRAHCEAEVPTGDT